MRTFEKMYKRIKNNAARRALSIVTTLVVILALIVAVLWLLVPQLVETIQGFVEQLPAFFDDAKNQINGLLEKNPEFTDWITNNFGKFDLDALMDSAVEYLEENLTVMIPSLLTFMGSVYAGVFNAFISFVFAIYCLVRKEILASQARRVLYSVVPEHMGDEVVRILRLTNATFSGFISGQCLEAMILGVLFAITMTIFRMPYVPLVSVIIAICALIPVVGAFIGCAFGTFFILVANPVQALWFVVLFLVVQQFEGNVIYPKVVGKSVGLPGMWVLLAVTVGGALMGISGMLLMIPLFSVLYTLLREFTEKRLVQREIPYDKVIAQPIDTSAERRKYQKKRRFLKHKLKRELPSAEDTENNPE